MGNSQQITYIVLFLYDIWVISFVSQRLYLFWKMLKGYLSIKEAQKNHSFGYPLKNMMHKDNMKPFAEIMFIIVNFICSILIFSQVGKWILLPIMLILTACVALVFMIYAIGSVFRFILMQQYAEFAFLTDTKLISVDGVYTKEDGRFTMEETENENGETNELFLNFNLYKKQKINYDTLKFQYKYPQHKEELRIWIQKNFQG